MTKEKMKTFILSILVITSILLTTQIWLNVSIEGIFVMPKKEQVISEEGIAKYNKMNLLKPNRIVVNLGETGMHTILFNEEKGYSVNDYGDASIYERILDETENVLKRYMNKDGVESIEKYSIEKLDTLRNERNIELIFENHLDAEIVSSILETPQEIFKDIKQIDSVIISSSDNKIFINDIESNAVYEYKFKKFETAFPYIISLTEKLENPYGVFLNEAYPELYSRKVVIPISMNFYKLPVLTGKKETEDLNTTESIENIVGKFFDFNAARSITDKNGTTIYTDGQGKSVRIEKSGVIEYMKYDTEANIGRKISKDEAVKMSIDFINRHLGFPEGAYISSIEENFQNDRQIGYRIGFQYSFLRTPIIVDSDIDNDPIEIKIVGNEIRSYKRFVKKLQSTQDLKEIKNAIEVLNTLFKNINAQMGIEKTTVQNMYLGYYEYQSNENAMWMIPVWVVELEQKEQNEIKKNQYIINAETSAILKY